MVYISSNGIDGNMAKGEKWLNEKRSLIAGNSNTSVREHRSPSGPFSLK